MKKAAFLNSVAIAALAGAFFVLPAQAQEVKKTSDEDSDAIFEIGQRGDTVPDVTEYSNLRKGLLLNESEEEKNILVDETIGTETDSDGKPVALTYEAVLKLYKAGQYDRALPHLELLANGGHLAAQEILGVMYNLGQGVPKDSKKAFSLLTAPADKGRALAQHHLGVMYFTGEGVEQQSGVQALMWLQLALINYPDGSEKQAAKRDRDAVYSRLNRRDRENAMIITREWLAKRGEAHLLDMTE